MITINKDACIGCGACVSIAENVFDFNDEGYAVVKDNVDDNIIKDNEEDIIDAIENCPTEAISK